MAVVYAIPDLHGYSISENKRVFSPYPIGESIRYVGKNKVELRLPYGWKTFEIDYLYKITFEANGIRL